MPFLRRVIAAAVLAALASPLAAQAVLDPPFGLHWGDSPEKLITWANRHALDVNIFVPGRQPELRVLRIGAASGTLPGLPAQEVEARFLAGKLIEVAVHYADPAAPPQVTEARFEKLKRQVTAEYGKLTPNRKDRTLEDGFATSRVSFHREPVRGLFLLLAFTEIEDTVRRSREARFSLIYRNENLRERLEKDLGIRPIPEPGPSPGAPVSPRSSSSSR